MKHKPRPNLFGYLDYRIYLCDMYVFLKATETGFSHRKFVQRAGLKAPNSLKRVMEGQVGLPVDTSRAFAKGLRLNPAETNYFEHLVAWNQESDPDTRAHHERKLKNARRRNQVASIDSDAYEFLSSWHIVAIRELLALESCPTQPDALAELLGPKITAREVNEALALLQRLGLIVNHQGRWQVCQPLLTTPEQVQKPAVRKYHFDMSKLACEALSRFASSERNFGAVSAGFNSARIEQLNRLLARQRQEMLDFLSDEEGGPKDIVFQVNYQAFPLSKRIGQSKGKKNA